MSCLGKLSSLVRETNPVHDQVLKNNYFLKYFTVVIY